MSVLLDTCVVSELNRSKPNPLVEAAVEDLGPENLFISVITIGEIQKGISLLPAGRRRMGFERWAVQLTKQYGDRVLDVDLNTAFIWGDLLARPRFRGRPSVSSDLLIAATALNHGMSVMTRNTRDFEATGVFLIDPWQGSDEP